MLVLLLIQVEVRFQAGGIYSNRRKTTRESLELLGRRPDLRLVPGTGLLGQQRLVDVGQHPSGGDGGGAEQAAELVVVAHGELDVARHDAGLLVVARRVARQLQNLRRRRQEPNKTDPTEGDCEEQRDGGGRERTGSPLRRGTRGRRRGRRARRRRRAARTCRP
jgi:hypothetical protein